MIIIILFKNYCDHDVQNIDFREYVLLIYENEIKLF